MGHSITGFILKELDLDKVLSRIPFDYFHRLFQRFVIFPLSADLIDQHIPAPQEYIFNEFIYLSSELFEMLKHASLDTKIVYLETDYHAGKGSQSAIAIFKSEVIFGPQNSASGVINQALCTIGVIKEAGHHDEFQSLGLSRLRSSKNLLIDAKPNGHFSENL